MAIDEVLSRCIEQWRGEGIPLGPPIDEAEIRFVWGCLGHRASRDVLRLYSTVGGFADWVSDSEFFWSLWPWGLIPEYKARYRGAGVPFCDHSIHVVAWELRFEDEEHSSVWLVGGSEPVSSRRTAPDLESFFRMYLDDPWRLL